ALLGDLEHVAGRGDRAGGGAPGEAAGLFELLDGGGEGAVGDGPDVAGQSGDPVLEIVRVEREVPQESEYGHLQHAHLIADEAITNHAQATTLAAVARART